MARRISQLDFEQGIKRNKTTENMLYMKSSITHRTATQRQCLTRLLEDAEIESVLKLCDNEWRGMVLTGKCTGQRIYEVATLHWDQVDFESRKIRFVSKMTGTASECYMIDSLFDYMQSQPRPSVSNDPVFPRACKVAEKSPRTLASEFRLMLERAGVKPYSFQSLRKTFITRLLGLGVPIYVVSKVVACPPRTVRRYGQEYLQP